MSYVYTSTSGWSDDLAAGLSTVGKAVVNAPTHVQQALATGKQIASGIKTSAQNVAATTANAKAASANAKALSQRGQDAAASWDKAKPFVYVGGAVILFLVVRKLV